MRLVLSFAGVKLAFSCDLPGTHLDLPSEHSPFLLPLLDSSPDALYRVLPLEDAPKPRGLPRWEEERLRFYTGHDTHHLLSIRDPLSGQWKTRVEMADSFVEGTIYEPIRGAEQPFFRAFHTPSDRIILVGLLATFGGIMVHGCSIAERNVGLLFTGPSGSGKTTTARLWEAAGAQCLNDERSILMPSGNGVVIGATPWHGEHPRIRTAVPPLAAIFHLVKSDKNAIRALPPADALSRLMTLTFIPVFREDGIALALSACAAMVERVPSFEFQFTPDARAVECCRDWLTEAIPSIPPAG